MYILQVTRRTVLLLWEDLWKRWSTTSVKNETMVWSQRHAYGVGRGQKQRQSATVENSRV